MSEDLTGWRSQPLRPARHGWRRPVEIGRLGGLEFSARPSAFAAFGLAWAGLAAAAQRFARLSLPAAIATGLAAVLLHWAGETAHQLGHAWAAQRTGYPMRGIRYWGLLSTCLYPHAEPELPAEIHIRRALGGAPVSLALGLFAGLFFLAFRRRNSVAAFLSGFLCMDSGGLLGLGAFLPLPFIDGGTLLHWWPRRGQVG